jgi:hypothetical protein
LGVEYPSYPCRQKVQILLSKSKWDTLSVLNIENENCFVSKNRGAAPLKTPTVEFASYQNLTGGNELPIPEKRL